MVDVYLYVYDLSCGAARTLGPLILGRPVGGIWHTSVVVFNKEFFYGSHGISYCPPGGTQLKEPGEKLLMGETNVQEDALFRYLERLAVTKFKGGDYRLFDHNCNTFSNHLVGYLTSGQIPSYILDLPEEIASTPLGAALKPALNLLSGGLDNVPQFGLHPAFSNGTNNHSFDGLRTSFRPILFDEPLPAELAPSRVRFLWPDTESSADKTRLAVSIAEAISNGDPEPPLEPAHYRLLALGDLQTVDQCRAVCELFRLIVWRNPNLIAAMLTDPERNLHHLAESRLPASNYDDALELHAARAKLLCNCLGLSQQWPAAECEESRLDLHPVTHIALLLLGHEEHKVTDDNVCLLLPEHRQIGLALAHNLALCHPLSADDALELGTYLMHLAVTQNKSYKRPVEAIYLLRAIYFLVVRFPIIADLARAYDLSGCLTAVMNEITDPEAVVPTEPYGKIGTRIEQSDVSLDYVLITHLLDYLSNKASEGAC